MAGAVVLRPFQTRCLCRDRRTLGVCLADRALKTRTHFHTSLLGGTVVSRYSWTSQTAGASSTLSTRQQSGSAGSALSTA